MEDLLYAAYPWIKALHIISVITWMAGLLYLPRLFANHAEHAPEGSPSAQMLTTMERKLLKSILNPAMILAWMAGIYMAALPGIIDWSSGYFYVKLVMVFGMTGVHHVLGRRRKDFEAGQNTRSARYYRMFGEVPALMMVLAVVMIIVRPF